MAVTTFNYILDVTVKKEVVWGLNMTLEVWDTKNCGIIANILNNYELVE